MKILHPIFYIILFSFQLSCGSGKLQTEEEEKPIHTNELIHESSPYLLQHAHNPVNWYPWGEKALQKAKDENKPIIISIGYAACHWCHVMEKESFEDSTIAAIMNEKFVCIKVDREERPDIDQIYMEAAQLINGNGGWPLNAFALPNGKPFYAATYFPKEQWEKLLIEISKAYTSNPTEIEEQAQKLTEGIQASNTFNTNAYNKTEFSREEYIRLYEKWHKTIDFEKGGFKGAPKFPLPSGGQFLLQYHYLSGNKEALKAAEVMLNEMAKGGIYDQIGGGFSRYSTDENWFAPHFEKMLYDNAQLVSLYSNAFKLTKNPMYKKIIVETIDFIERELSDKNGAYFSSLNADSEGEEGLFYVWTKKEIINVLGEEGAKHFIKFFNITTNGNWEKGKNILYKSVNETEFAIKNRLDSSKFKSYIEEQKLKLLNERSKRIRPTTDDKILTSWNALMISAYLDAYAALGNSDYLATALKTATFIRDNVWMEDGSLYRNYKDGKASIPAFLDDYALLANAYLKMYESTFDIQWLNLSKQIVDFVILNFKDEDQVFFYYTSKLDKALVARKLEVQDNVIPSSNSVMANVIYRLSILFEDKKYEQLSQMMIAQLTEQINSSGVYYANWAQLMGLISYGNFEIAIVGEDFKTKNEQLQNHYLPTSIFMGGTNENLPLLEQKLMDDRTMIYVCQNKMCQLPVEKVIEAFNQLEKLK